MPRARSHTTSDPNRDSAKQRRDSQRARVLQSVVNELERDRGTQAVQLFREGQDHGLFPTGTGLPRWLIKTIGREATGKLVDAFAQFPCFYCEKGLERCEACAGHGTIAGGMICEACAGLSVTRCGFCDGSGWITNNVVPPGLRLVVLAERVNRACGHVASLLQKPVPTNASAEPAKAAKRCAKELLDLNRQLGVLENAVVASKDLARTHPSSKEKLVKTVGMCCRAAANAQTRVRELVKQMSVCSKEQAEASELDSAVRERAEKGSTFYESLASSKTFAGTALEHPRLQQAVAKLGRRDRTRSPPGTKTRSSRRR